MGAFIPPTAIHSRVARSALHCPTSSSAPVAISTPSFALSTQTVLSQTAPARPPRPPVLVRRLVVVWFRSDLRLHDNPCLSSLHDCTIVPLLLLPPAPPQPLIDAAHDLRASLRNLGADLYVRPSRTDCALALTDFCQHVAATKIRFAEGVTKQQRALDKRIETKLAAIGTSVSTFWSGALLNPEQLPFPIHKMPEDCDLFAAAVQPLRISPPLPAPRSFHAVSNVDTGYIPGSAKGKGGEKLALKLLDEYCKNRVANIHEGKLITSYSRLGPFLDMGCLSPRLLWDRVVAGGQNSVKRYCAEFELWFREFVKFMTLKHGVHPHRL